FSLPLESEQNHKAVIFVKFSDLLHDSFPYVIGSFFFAIKAGGRKKLQSFVIAHMPEERFDIFSGIDPFRFSMQSSPIKAQRSFRKTFDWRREELLFIF